MKSTLSKRIIAFFIDFIPLGLLFNLLLSCIMLTTEKTMFELVDNGVYYIILCLLGLLWCFKDIFNGASIGKRVVKLRVVDENNKKPPIYRLILRNLTAIIWPVEAFLLLSKYNKLGDKFAKTQVVEA